MVRGPAGRAWAALVGRRQLDRHNHLTEHSQPSPTTLATGRHLDRDGDGVACE
ncbi:MAG: hypothetical protein GEV08_21115 [Acidimicrobiia bacterium]|nr:hypothetical protein [Acidimicrobiia bacterium]